MVGRSIVSFVALVATLAVLLLLASGSNVEAGRYKIQYSGSLSCAGTDGIYGTGDDSCVEDPTYGPYGAGLNADMLSHFEIPNACIDGLDQDADTVADDGCPGGPPAVGRAEGLYSQFSYLATMGIPSNWWVATDSQIPNGAFIGTLDATSTLALFGGSCNTTLPVHFPMYDCTTNNFEGVNDGCAAVSAPETDHECNDNQDNDGDTTVNDGCPAVGPAETGTQCDNHDDDDGDGDPIVAWDEATSGENLTYGHLRGLPAACNKYPKHVNTIVEGLRPRARYYGFTIVIAGMAPTQVEFLIFNPEELTELGVLPEADMGDDLGYINYVILDNPRVPAAADSALDELCTPLITETNLHGITDGEGELIQEVPPVPPDPFVGPFWVVPDPCGNGIDDDADTRIDEMCGFERVRNPEENTGISGTGSHLLGAYSESYRDADGDTIPNNEDECPYVYDTGVDTDSDYIDDACDPTNNPGPMADEDGDGWRNQADNCPLVFQTSQANDADDDSIGDECDVGWDDDGDGAPTTDVNEECAEQQGCAELGAPEVVCDGAEAGGQCANAIDDDGDGVVNDGCPANGVPESGRQCRNNIDDGEDWPAPDGVVNDGCPAAALDDDGDTYVNDGCAGATAETGAQCLDGPRHPDGHYVNDLYLVSSTCIDDVDSDGDGWCDATEDIVGHGGQVISVKCAPADCDNEGGAEVEADLNPVDGVKDCVDGIDNDGDGYIDGAYAPAGCQGLGCDAGCSTPEWRVIDPLIRAADNPPGQAPGTCSNRQWYDVERLGGPEVDDDGDTVVNWLDPNCRGMKLDLQGSITYPPLELPCANVIGTSWHELWPTYSNMYTATSHIDHDGDTTLSQGDQIDFDDGHDYHVDEVTITIKTDTPEEKYLEFYASATDFGEFADGIDDMQDAIYNPQSTQWHEIWPTWSQEYDLLTWVDNTDGYLSASDQVVLVNKDNPADIADYHVERVSIDIIVTQKPDGDIDQDGVPDDGKDGIPGNDDDDNCVDEWNPTQLDTDGDGIGDECDADDDEDKLLDTAEWAAGSDPKNVCNPRNYNLNPNPPSDGKIDILDVLVFSNKIMGMPCDPGINYDICEPVYRSLTAP